MQANPKLSTTPPLPGVVAVPALNDALQTIATDFSGDTDPAALAWPFSKWADTSTGLLKRRNAAGTEWVVEGSLFRRALNIIPSDQIPTSDIGLISTPSQGLMEWDGSRYVAKWADHGQCRFVYVSQTECRLMPCNGNGLIINGRQCRIPVAGVPITTASTSASSRYWVFAVDDGSGGVTLELSNTASSSYSAFTDGVVVKTGDPSRTLVGWAATNASNTFLDSTSFRFVASWFNRRRRGVSESVGGSTGSTSVIGLGTGVVLFAWADEEVEATISGYGTLSAAAFYTMEVRRDGVDTPPFVPRTLSGRSAAGQASISATTRVVAGEGEASYRLFGSVSAGTLTVVHRVHCSTNI
ncbi:hypothetical protein [Achromobacter xylosoxidans]|uniref:Uncharacterized protein n=1 Tax=Alcaligenes xylosoxydans xylosoxydans TaxID=85698 RepID=A0A1R1JVP9_ALCXX|nr:hypothetical protein [Achromobacter xylosoxidans]OMG89714.1 hypothetical protein BIZ92_23140 [Achromobacter xylosoxidans]